MPRGCGRQSSLVIRVRTSLKSFSLFIEDGVVRDAGTLKRELECGLQHFEAVGDAAAEIDGRSFLKILGGAGYFSNAEAEVDALGEHLVIENEIDAVLTKGQTSKDIAAEGAVSGVIFGELDA